MTREESSPPPRSTDFKSLVPAQRYFVNAPVAELMQHAISAGTAARTRSGAIVVRTGARTGRSPNDKFIVRDDETATKVEWGPTNRPFASEQFEGLLRRVQEHMSEREVFVEELVAGADSRYQLPVRIATTSSWHALFVKNMFRQVTVGAVPSELTRFTVLHAPEFEAVPARDGTNSEAFVILDFSRSVILIGGTQYAGEIKKSVFSVLNYLLPELGVLPMHAAANVGSDDRACVLFGLSGTGKTTLSADRGRRLIGDDEHGWTDQGVFNFEGGCYAKTIKLSATAEPAIWRACGRVGSILENVDFDSATGEVDFDSARHTSNTRASYPLSFIEGAVADGLGPHPSHVLMLTADACGVLPPIAKLTTEQAMQQFLIGYTSKTPGTEGGVTEPTATFSACFGKPFLPRPARVYAELLGKKVEQHATEVWLVNTGWTAGGYGVGHRISIEHTRAMVSAITSGQLASANFKRDPIFGLSVPAGVSGVPSEVLDVRGSWADPAAYDAAARRLVAEFERVLSPLAMGLVAQWHLTPAANGTATADVA